MAMLAEPRRKLKIGPNPRGQLFIDDEENVGRSMLRNMGWKEGHGLGVTHQGISEPIKPKIQQDSRGLGFDVKSSPWVTHNDKFSEILANLNVEYCGENSSEPVMNEKVNTETSSAGNELEKKSKSSRARIHYHKSIKNKDLSKISNKDWSCIFGKTVDVDESVGQSNSNVNLEQETQKYVNSGSMADYFKAKMEEKKKIKNEEDIKQETDLDNIESTIVQPEKKKIKIEQDIKQETDLDNIESTITQPEKKKKQRDVQVNVTAPESTVEQPEVKTKKKRHRDVQVDVTTPESTVEQPEVKTKKKKHRDVQVDVMTPNPTVEQPEANKNNMNNSELEPKFEKYINAGSMVDYFKAKMQEKMLKKPENIEHIKQETDLDNIESTITQPEKRKKQRDVQVDVVTPESTVEQPEVKTKKKRHRDVQVDVTTPESTVEQPEVKTKKKKHRDVQVDVMTPESTVEQPEVKTKKKKHRDVQVDVTVPETTVEQPEVKTKKKKHRDVQVDVTTPESTVEQPEVKTKKKKHRDVQVDVTAPESTVEQPEVKTKKKKHKDVPVDVTTPNSTVEQPAANENNLNNSELEENPENFINRRHVWDKTTVKSVAKKYIGSNILDIPGYPISYPTTT